MNTSEVDIMASDDENNTSPPIAELVTTVSDGGSARKRRKRGEQDELASAIILSEDGERPAPPVLRKSVFEDKAHFPKRLVDGKEGWSCTWCGTVFKNLNATKARKHACKRTSAHTHVSSCRAVIPDEWLQCYRDLDDKIRLQTEKRKSRKSSLQEEVEEDIKLAAGVPMGPGTPTNLKDPPEKLGSIGGDDASSFSRQMTIPSMGMASPKEVGAIELNAQKVADTAFAKMVHVMKLGLNHGEHELVRAYTKAVAIAGPRYQPPKRYRVGGTLLEKNFNQVTEKNTKLLRSNARKFGVMWIGDGATIGKFCPRSFSSIVSCVISHTSSKKASPPFSMYSAVPSKHRPSFARLLTARKTWRRVRKRMQYTLPKYF
jgi:hypothetical protein